MCFQVFRKFLILKFFLILSCFSVHSMALDDVVRPWGDHAVDQRHHRAAYTYRPWINICDKNPAIPAQAIFPVLADLGRPFVDEKVSLHRELSIRALNPDSVFMRQSNLQTVAGMSIGLKNRWNNQKSLGTTTEAWDKFQKDTIDEIKQDCFLPGHCFEINGSLPFPLFLANMRSSTRTGAVTWPPVFFLPIENFFGAAPVGIHSVKDYRHQTSMLNRWQVLADFSLTVIKENTPVHLLIGTVGAQNFPKLNEEYDFDEDDEKDLEEFLTKLDGSLNQLEEDERLVSGRQKDANELRRSKRRRLCEKMPGGNTQIYVISVEDGGVYTADYLPGGNSFISPPYLKDPRNYMVESGYDDTPIDIRAILNHFFTIN